MYDDLQNDNNLVDNSNFDTSYYEEEDFIEDYEKMMAELDDQDPMEILPEMDPDVDFYEALDGWGNYYYEEEQITDRLAKKGKSSHKKFKEDENEFKKEFSDELAMLYDLLDEANKFNKKLVKKYDAIDGSKAKGTSKYLNDLIESVIASNTSKLHIIKEITSLKKTIQELKIKADGKKAGSDTTSIEGQANSFFKDIMSVGRNNFVSALNGDPDHNFIDMEYSEDMDIEYANSLPDVNDYVHDRINERLMESSTRSADAEKYIMYEHLRPELVIFFNVLDNTWEVVAIDKDGQKIIDYPVPTRKELGKCKFSSDNRYMTDAFGRSYKVMEKYN